MVFQDLALWPNLSTIENVMLGLSGDARERARDALDLCDIADLSDRRPGLLSGGEQQRVALARAMATRPAFLLLDEPFAGLDLVTKESLLDRIGSLRDQRGFTIILVTHDPFEVQSLCDRAVVLEAGQVREEGTLDELLRDPSSELLRRFRERL